MSYNVNDHLDLADLISDPAAWNSAWNSAILCRYYSYSYWYILNKSNFITYKLDVKCLDCRKWKSGQCTIADFGLKTCDSLMLVVKQYFLIYTHLFEILTFKTSLYN